MFEFRKRSYIMGILNITPDSFSDGGKFFDVEEAVKHAHKMVAEGADIIDIGGESTRPGAEEVLVEDELKRIIPVLKRLIDEIEILISVDTYKAEVAKEVLELGVDIINDIWGLQWDQEMAGIVAEYDVPVVIMHNARSNKHRKNIIKSIKDFLKESISIAKKAGIKDKKIILDPGIGFGTTHEENVEIMRELSELKELGYPLLLGTSRKSMIGNILNLPFKERVEVLLLLP